MVINWNFYVDTDTHLSSLSHIQMYKFIDLFIVYYNGVNGVHGFERMSVKIVAVPITCCI